MVDVIGWRLDDVVALIKGPKGSKVRLEILPAGKGTKTRTVTLTRERIRLEDRAVKMSVKTVGKEKVGVLDIPGFYVGLTDDVKVQLQKLEKQNVSSVIIDLRSNGGGALTEAVSLSGLFIPAGPIVQVRDNNGKVREDSDTDGQVFYKGPLVVLVDRFSASASEIFAAAMQDYGRALVVGEPTFGKGTVQQYRSLNRIYDQMLRPEWPALGSVQYTIQKFYRVNGGSTQRKGVTPDIIMPTGNEETETGEKFEDNALPWDSIDAATYVKSGDLTAFEPELLKEHNARIAKDPEFQNIMKDIARLRALADTGARIMGSSSIRYCREIRDFLAKSEQERGKILTVYGTSGTDEFNYSIHIVEGMSALAGAPLVFRQRRGGVLAGHGRGAGEDDERQFRVVGIPGTLESGFEALIGAHHHLRLFDACGGQKRLHASVEHGQPVPGRAAHWPVDHRQQPRHAGYAFQRPENATAVHRLQSV